MVWLVVIVSMSLMVSIYFQQSQVTDAIMISDSIKMVNYLVSSQRPSQVKGHDGSMLKDIAVFSKHAVQDIDLAWGEYVSQHRNVSAGYAMVYSIVGTIFGFGQPPAFSVTSGEESFSKLYLDDDNVSGFPANSAGNRNLTRLTALIMLCIDSGPVNNRFAWQYLIGHLVKWYLGSKLPLAVVLLVPVAALFMDWAWNINRETIFAYKIALIYSRLLFSAHQAMSSNFWHEVAPLSIARVYHG